MESTLYASSTSTFAAKSLKERFALGVIGRKFPNEIVVGQVRQHLFGVHKQKRMALLATEFNHHEGKVATAGPYIQDNLSALSSARAGWRQCFGI